MYESYNSDCMVLEALDENYDLQLVASCSTNRNRNLGALAVSICGKGTP